MLANPRSERVKRVAALSGRSARSRTGLILVEGPQAVRELLAHRARAVRDVYFSQTAAERHADLFRAAERATRYVHTVSQAVAEAMSGDAQGVIAVADAAAVAASLAQAGTWGNQAGRGEPDREESGRAAPAHLGRGNAWESARLVVVLAEAQDPGNVGTIIRLADACGAQAVVIAKGGVDVTSPKVIRSSVGSVFHLPIVRGADFADVLAELRGSGLQVLAAHGYGDVSLEELLVASLSGGATAGAAEELVAGPDLSAPTAWVFGNEARGLSQAQIDACDAAVKIALRGHAESFNVAGAAAILLHASSLAQARR